MKSLSIILTGLFGVLLGAFLMHRWLHVSDNAAEATPPPAMLRPRVVESVSPPIELDRLTREKAALTAQLADSQARLAERDTTLAAAREQLAELRRPMEVDMLSSALRADLKSGEVVVTGGYRLPDGKRLYAFVKPVIGKTDDGGETVTVSSRFLSLDETAGKSVGLDNLDTNAANTLQHGEVWVADEETEVLKKLEGVPGIEVLTSPEVSVRPGSRGLIEIGDLRLRVTPALKAGGDGMDFEVRLEQPQVPPKMEMAPVTLE
ncbi:hypothetical protein [Rariglobus hedericola]|uniref:Uncharacterized protein n=1 Tax=Rariglobus hedericola TaxID=2597822 RepID=A0A556QL83_9BACT|nr:hypothetical protein [Rariglobus hedericola]TSJ77371.1 hypothetical protein FPL22_14865 [Rariglobus hedericola]